jgi:hypothetical protein
MKLHFQTFLLFMSIKINDEVLRTKVMNKPRRSYKSLKSIEDLLVMGN